jgi:hypothetical protein
LSDTARSELEASQVCFTPSIVFDFFPSALEALQAPHTGAAEAAAAPIESRAAEMSNIVLIFIG